MTYEQTQQRANNMMLLTDKALLVIGWLAERGIQAQFTIISCGAVSIYLARKPTCNIEGTEIYKTKSQNAGRTVYCRAHVKGCSIHWEEKVQ